MTFSRIIIPVTTLAITITLGGCFHDSGDSASADAYSMGTVTGLGSVYVNNVRYDTTGATVTRDGVLAIEAEVLGLPTKVSGTISGSSGTATTVKAETAVKGTVNSITNNTSMVVMGQTVRLDDAATVSTLAGNDVLSDLTASTSMVEVAGLVKPGGIIVATVVEEKAALTEYKVNGYITSVDSGALTLVIGGKTVDYSGADISDLGGSPAADMLVKAKASSDANPLAATVIEKEGPEVTNATAMEIEGYIKQLSGSEPNYSFSVAGQSVQTSNTTTFETGNNAYLANNVKVEVEGSLSNGTLTATTVSLRDSVRVEGDITNLSSNSFSIEGLAGITFTVQSDTEYSSTNDILGDFANGTHVRVRGFPSGVTSVSVTRLDERNADTAVFLRGPAEAVSSPNVTVLGVTVDTSSVTFQDQNDTTILSAAFFGTIGVGTPVKISGDEPGGTITWTDIELED